MSQLESLSLFHFKNYLSKQFSFSKRMVCISGPNGSGKTSILDAIHFLCFTKSYFHHVDANCVSKGLEGMRVSGKFKSEKLDEVICILRENGKKEFILNEEPYQQFSKHIGKFPCVMIAPDDTELITGGSELRRRFLDTMIAQTNSMYLEQLISYNKFLQQRNALLKQWMNTSQRDFSLLSFYSKKLDEIGTMIHQTRQHYCDLFFERVSRIYHQLCNEKEEIISVYHSQLSHDILLDLLDQFIDKDIASQRTNYGIHKDDLVFQLNGMPFKQVASQGQRKSFLFSLKLAQHELIKELTGKQAILLLDDIFEKLDEFRSAELIRYLMHEQSQVFITDTHESRMRLAFEDYPDEVEYIVLQDTQVN